MISTIGVLGAGQMGNGIAHVFAQVGYQVVLFDIAPQQLEKAVATIQKNLERQAKKGIIEASLVTETLARIKTTQQMEDLAAVDFAIEAVTETFAFLAKRGAGKSYAACVLVEEMLDSEHWTERRAAVCLLRRWGKLSATQKERAEQDTHVAVRHGARGNPLWSEAGA